MSVTIPEVLIVILITLAAVMLIILIVWAIKKLIQAHRCGKWPFSQYQYSYSVVQKPKIVKHRTAIQRRRAQRVVVVEEPACPAYVADPVVEEYVAAEQAIPVTAPTMRQVRTQVVEQNIVCDNCLNRANCD
ncbi:MAG: hypothetical protein LBH66_06145 [Oscillospiraceae bacterium]|jgi:hypothetical protein|nr:hypothetical protein [Oscillospiraceae bacterium]